MLMEEEIEHIIKRLDLNEDGYLSPREFRNWLFPTTTGSSVSSSSYHHQEESMTLLMMMIEDMFEGDMIAFFDHCKG
jgi:Ca2+-binding EF-hand superfamily protein